MIRCTKKGYFTLEAAIFLPIFILGILTLGYFIKIYSTTENMAYSAIDETAHLAAQAYGRKAAPLFPTQTEERLKKENEQAQDIRIKSFRYLYEEGGRDGLISLKLSYHVDVRLPLGMHKETDREERIRCRGFIGRSVPAEPMSFDEMERNDDSELVWIFPVSGEKYHDEDCSYVKANAKQMVLTGGIKNRYGSCSLCDSENLPLGSLVYCFIDTGRAYHRGSCKTIEKYTIEIEKEDAEEKGYTPCSKCKGG